MAGVPDAVEDHARRVCFMALDMADSLNAIIADPDGHDRPQLRMRIGIHSGAVVAGIIGTRKFKYGMGGAWAQPTAWALVRANRSRAHVGAQRPACACQTCGPRTSTLRRSWNKPGGPVCSRWAGRGGGAVAIDGADARP